MIHDTFTTALQQCYAIRVRLLAAMAVFAAGMQPYSKMNLESVIVRDLSGENRGIL